MHEKHATPYHFLKEFSPDLLKFDAIPLLGHPPKFPFQEFADHLKKLFNLSHVSIEVSNFDWVETANTWQNLHSPLFIQGFAISTLAGDGAIAINAQDVDKLLSLIFKIELSALATLDQDFKDAMRTFVSLEALSTFQHIPFDKSLSIQLLEDAKPESTLSLCTDLLLTINDLKIGARLAISPALRDAIAKKYALSEEQVFMNEKMATKLTVTAHLIAGETKLSSKEWADVSPGDLILLDHCTIDPTEGKGKVKITINNREFLRAKIRPGQIKIMDSLEAQFYETEDHSLKDH